MFEKNAGQADPLAKYVARGSGGVLLFANREIVAAVPRRKAAGAETELSLVRLSFPGSNPETGPVPEDAEAAVVSYIKGQNPASWKRGIPTCRRLVWPELYPDIDLVCYGAGGRLEYDFVVKPGGDPGVIRLAFKGVHSVKVDQDGLLCLDTGSGTMVHEAPVVKQGSHPVTGAFRQTGEHEVAFTLDGYDPSKPVVIDPVMQFCSYLGGNSTDRGLDIQELPDGSLIVAGVAYSSDFPLKNSTKATLSSADIFLTRLTADGQSLISSTYLGGNGTDWALALDVGPSGDIFIGGTTSSTDFPLRSALQSSLHGSSDAFLMQFDSAGTNLLFSTYYGGNRNDYLHDMTVTADSNICFVGRTNSSDFPMQNAVNSTYGGGHLYDAFAVRLDASRSIVFSTYLGGTGTDWARGIALDAAGAVYVSGSTSSTDFSPMGGGVQSVNSGGDDAFVTKLGPSGVLVWSTYLGGTGSDGAYDIAVDAAGNAVVAGYAGAGFPLVTPIRSTVSGDEGFISKIGAAGTNLVYSTFVGGNAGDQCHSVVLDSDGNAYAAGETESTDFPSVGAWQNVVGGNQDAFVAGVDPAGAAWRFAGQFGGSGNDGINNLSLAANGDLLVAGTTYSTDFPVLNPVQAGMGTGTPDAFFARMTSPAAMQAPFFDDFEWGRLNGGWTATGYTRVETGSNPAPHGGSYHLAFGIHAYGVDEATLQVDLNGRVNTILRFWYMKSSPNGPRYATVLPDTFSGSVNGNGVAISGDGTHWVKIMGMSDSEENPSVYAQYEIELDPIMAAHGISSSGIVYIRFIGYGTNPPGGAHFVDDLTILSRSVQFAAGAVSTPEGQDVTLTVVRSGSTAVAESVDFATFASNATEDVDYSGTTGTVVFAVGQSSGTITVPVHDDAVEEPVETFRVRLSNPSPGLDLGSPAVATVTIQDDDASEVFPFRVGFESGVLGPCWTTYAEDNGVIVVDENDGSSGYPDTPSGSRSVWLDSSIWDFLSELNLHIDLSAQQNVTLEFLARGIGGDNFTLPTSFTGHANGKGVAVSADGATWYRILDLGQAPYEFTRYTFDLDAIFAAHGLSYGPGVQVRFVGYGNHYFDALGFDDVRIFSPNFEFKQAAASSLETDNATLTVLRKGSTAGSASVNYATVDGSATAGADYSSISGTLAFADGVASNTITVPILNSPDVEPDKTFTVTLSNPSSGYSLGAITQATVTIVDDDASTALPVNETFGGVLADYWTTFGRAEIVDSELQLLDGGLREAILTVNPASRTNLFLQLRYRDLSGGNYTMPATFSGHNDSDGIAVSGDGTNWVKVLGLTHAEGTPGDLSYTNATVSLDPFLQAHGISVAGPLKIKFQNYSASSGSEFDFDNVVVYSRQPLEVLPSTLPHGTGMVAYAVSLSVSNGTPPYVWSTTNTLPNGLTLSEGGELSGTPTEEGSFPFNVSVIDAWGATGAASRELEIDPNTNRPPFVTARDPNTNTWVMGEGTNALFTLKAVDPEGAPLTYTWTLDGADTATVSTSFVYQTDWSDAGHHVLDVRVSDGLWSNALASWAVQVSADNDGDGMSNAWERTYGLDPWDAADAGLDPDGDHLTNLQEAQLGTSPTYSDSNGDSLSDGWQNLYGQDPLQARTLPVISLTRLGAVGGISNAQAVAAFGDVVYVADGQNGMLIFDASTATNPVLVQQYSTKDFAWDVSVESNRLYWADGTNGLLKINVTSDPYAVLDSFQYLYSPVRVFKSTVDRTTAYVSTFDDVDDFHVLDVTDGAPSPFRGELDTTNSARDVAIQGSLAYVAGGDGEFTIIDVSNPDAPVVRGTLDTAAGTQGFEIAVTGTVAYLGVNSGDIYVADVSNPDAPVWTHTNTFASAAVQEIIAQDGFVFMAQDGEGIYSDGGLYVFDATNSDWSVSITNIPTMDYIEDICVTSNRLFVVDDEQGLVVFDYISDYDRDGLTDSWERARLGSLDQNADDDPDGDGITNLGEARAGTDPLKVDSDGDLIPDGWEATHLLNPAEAADGTGNADGDPCNNSAEYVADTDPLDAADWFHITSISSNLPMDVFFYSSTNRVYTMLGNSNLVSGMWVAVPGSGPRRGVGGADAMVDTNEPPRGPYYRMDVALP